MSCGTAHESRIMDGHATNVPRWEQGSAYIPYLRYLVVYGVVAKRLGDRLGGVEPSQRACCIVHKWLAVFPCPVLFNPRASLASHQWETGSCLGVPWLAPRGAGYGEL